MEEQRELNPIACFLTACEIERRASRTSRREQRVVNGRRILAENGRFIYSFRSSSNTTEPLNVKSLKDDDQVQVVANNASYHGTVVSVQRGSVNVALNSDLGDHIERARIDSEPTDLLQALILRLRTVQRGELSDDEFNRRLANSLLNVDELPRNFPDVNKPEAEYEDLTSDQYNAFERCAKQDLTFVWGPPGTGKTVLLAALAQRFFQENKRVLIVSHTNHAVDGVIEALCKRLTSRRKVAVPEGAILRVGTPVKDSLIGAFGDQVGLEAVVAKSHQKVSSRLRSLQQELSGVRDELFAVSKKIVLFDSYQQLKVDLQKHSGDTAQIGAGAGFKEALGRLFQLNQGSDGDELEFVEDSLKNIEREVAGSSRATLIARSVELSERQVELTEAIVVLDKFTRDLRLSLLERARVVGTTATTAVLSPRELSGFDVVLIDEASMVPLPLCYVLVGMARQRCVVAGDFRQLPAIASSDSALVKQWYARDAFEASGVAEVFNAGGQHPAAAALTLQFRSHQQLCDLINDRFYGGRLVTHPSAAGAPHIFKEPLTYLNHARVVLVDTASLNPWGSSSDRSKSNLTHALITRKLSLLLYANGLAFKPENLGIITPYRAQAELIKELLEECSLGSAITVGTVHKYQGGERDTIILDLTESEPHLIGSFLNSESIADTGARLLNVALSRAKRHLIVVGNLDFLRQKLSPRAILSGVLKDLEQVGYKLPVDQLVSESVFPTPSLEVRSSAEVLAYQSFNGEQFPPGLVADLLEARSEVVLVSPTCSRGVCETLAAVLEARIRGGIRVSIYTSDCSRAGYDQDAGLLALRRAGVDVIKVSGVLPSCAVIDSEIVWLGSIAPLDSFGVHSGEMTRSVSGRAALYALNLCGQHGYSPKLECA